MMETPWTAAGRRSFFGFTMTVVATVVFIFLRWSWSKSVAVRQRTVIDFAIPGGKLKHNKAHSPPNVDRVNISWVNETNSCQPDICGGSYMPDIHGLLPYYKGKWIPNRVIGTYTWYDTHQVLDCFHDQLITILGDSTSTETALDLLLLLSGVNSKGDKAGDILLANATDTRTLVSYRYDGFFRQNTSYPTVVAEFTGGERRKENNRSVVLPAGIRNFTTFVPSLGITVRHRFTGAANIPENYGGIDSIMHSPEFADEFNCLYGKNSSGCRRPDVLVVQSSFHEVEDVDRFAQNIDEYMIMLTSVRDAGCRVFWKGTWNATSPHESDPDRKRDNAAITELNRLAEQAAKKHGIPFINLMDVFTFSSKFLDFEGTLINLPHLGAIAGNPFDGALSTLMTQEVLRHVC